jgi:tetratricopeptide (TPR) repeat protein
MTKLQWAVIIAALALFFTLYFGCERTPPDIAELETTRSLSVESTTPTALLDEAKSKLNGVQLSEVAALEDEAQMATADSSRAGVYQRLSSQWYQLGHPALAGYYAEEVASLRSTEESWSIAGTTYSICIQRSGEEKIREFCSGRAVQAFENAISLNPENTAHRVNLALTYTANPPADNPMKGVLMLRELNQEEPNNVLVLNALARLAIKTGQYERAVERLEAAAQLSPDNANTICLLAQAYEGKGDNGKAQEYAEKCRSLSQ